MSVYLCICLNNLNQCIKLGIEIKSSIICFTNIILNSKDNKKCFRKLQ